MNRSKYTEYIEEKLATLSIRIEAKGKLNVLNLHLHSESFYMHFFNLLFDWNLVNLNIIKQNVESIDLIDDNLKIIIQVSATATKSKIESTLQKDIMKTYKDYNFKFISISKKVDSLRDMTFVKPNNISFIPSEDIYDLSSVFNFILSLGISKQKTIYEFIKKELGNDIDVVKMDSNLAYIINILAKEDLTNLDDTISINYFEIERKIAYNNLVSSKLIIDDYKIHYSRLNKKYEEFDKMGSNKSFSVLSFIRKVYIKNLHIAKDDELFILIINKLIEIITNSSNYIEIPFEELELCVNIIVVDSFIRCKIFKNPKDYDHVITR